MWWQIESVSSEDIDSLVTSISLELSQQRANLAQRSSSSAASHQVEPRFILDKSKPQSDSKAAGYCRIVVYTALLRRCVTGYAGLLGARWRFG